MIGEKMRNMIDVEDFEKEEYFTLFELAGRFKKKIRSKPIVKSPLSKGKVAGYACIVERGKENELFNLISLYRIFHKTYHHEDCPICKRRVPLLKPGSRKQIIES